MAKVNEEGVILIPEGFEDFVNQRATIKLKEFSKVFFPMFVAYFSGETVDLRAWFFATKTKGTVPVDVIDTKSEVAFTVPPLFTTARQEFGHGLQKDPADIMRTAQIKDREVPGAGNRYIEDNLTAPIDYNEFDEKQQEAFLLQWVKIFNYYGYESDDIKTKTSGKDNLPNDDLGEVEYDEI